MAEEDFVRGLINRLARVEPVVPCPPVKIRKRIRAVPITPQTEPLDEETVRAIIARYKEP